MPTIDEHTIPGTVSVPTWVMVAAIIALFGAREFERRVWFARMGEATKALDLLTVAVGKLTEVIEKCKP